MSRNDQKETDAEIAQRLVALLEEADGKVKHSLRKRERIPYFRSIDLILIREVGQPQLTGYSRNLSSGGIGLLSRRMFKVGEHFATLLSLGGGLGKFVFCRVTFCRYVSDCMYELGAQFEATATRLSSKQKIPDQWITLARAHNSPTPTLEKAPTETRSNK